MSDPADRATALEELQRDEALHLHKTVAGIADPVIERNGKRICIDCLEKLTAKRIKAAPNSGRCVECQGIHEKQRRIYR